MAPEEFSCKTMELHSGDLEIGRLNGSKRFDEERTQLEFELDIARSSAKELALQIEESNANLMVGKAEVQSPKNTEPLEELAPFEVLKELDHVTRELIKLKLDIASASEAKEKAEKEIEESDIKTRVCSRYIEELKRERDLVNEEQLLVELARMEAEAEIRHLDAQRADEAAQFSSALVKAKKEVRDRRKEIRSAKNLEKELAMTTSDVNVLQNEMEFIRAMENPHKNQSKKNEEETQAELEAAKKKLVGVKEVVFQLMASIDLIRANLMKIGEESEHLMKSETSINSTIQYLNSILLKYKSKLKSTLAANERTNSVILNLSTALQNLQTDLKEAKQEEDLVTDEIKAIQIETGEINVGIESTEERLRAAMEELQSVKASESIALTRLKAATERRSRAQVLSTRDSSSITISKFEHSYLIGLAGTAQAVADSKVAAAQAWIEALEAREKEVLLETEIIERGVTNEREWKEAEHLDMQFVIETSRGLRGGKGALGESRRRKKRRSSASSVRRLSITHSPPFVVKNKRKVMANLMRILKRQKAKPKTGKLK